MSTAVGQTTTQDHASKGYNVGQTGNGHTNEARGYDYGGNPLARADTSDSIRLPAFGGNLEPGLFRMQEGRKFGNPAPLGLCAFAFTTFLLSLINLGTRGTATPNLVVAAAWGYGGLVQLLAGMWEFAQGNTFGATALSSYGGFWISFAIIFTPGGFNIEGAYGLGANPSIAAMSVDSSGRPEFFTVFSFYLFGWFIFTSVLLLACFKSTVAFFFLFFTLDLAFLCLALGYYFYDVDTGAANHSLNLAGGVFGILAAFAAWYNALAGILEPSNSFFLIPVAHFPWSEKGRERRGLPTVAQLEREKTNKSNGASV